MTLDSVSPSLRQLNSQQLLLKSLCAVTLDAAVIPTGLNVGIFDDNDQLIMPIGNAGTVLTFSQLVQGYKYIDIVIRGTAVKVSCGHSCNTFD